MAETENFFVVCDDHLKLRIKATPGASKTEILDVREGALRVRVAAAPEGGRANAALVAFLSAALGLPKNQIALLSGEKSRQKTLRLPLAAREKLAALLDT